MISDRAGIFGRRSTRNHPGAVDSSRTVRCADAANDRCGDGANCSSIQCAAAMHSRDGKRHSGGPSPSLSSARLQRDSQTCEPSCTSVYNGAGTQGDRARGIGLNSSIQCVKIPSCSFLRKGPMKVIPLNDKILVRRLEVEEKTAGGILLPDTAKEKPRQGK